MLPILNDFVQNIYGYVLIDHTLIVSQLVFVS